MPSIIQTNRPSRAANVIFAVLILILSVVGAYILLATPEAMRLHAGYVYFFRSIELIAPAMAIGMWFAEVIGNSAKGKALFFSVLISVALLAAGLLSGYVFAEDYVFDIFDLIPGLILMLGGLLLISMGPLQNWSLPILAFPLAFLFMISLFLPNFEKADPLFFNLGAIIAVLTVILPIFALWRHLSRPWMLIPLRILGSWMLAIGLMYLGFSYKNRG